MITKDNIKEIIAKRALPKQIFLSVVLLASMLQFTNLTPIDAQTQKDRYIASNFGGMQNVKLSQKKLSNLLSVNIAQYKSAKQSFGSQQLKDSLEANTQLLLSYQIKNSLHMTSNFGFTYSKQDISTMSSFEKKNAQHEKMIYGSFGLNKYFLKDLALRGNLGLVGLLR